ncbi:DUF1917 domain-containing protein [Nitrosomonas sp. JL21]|uniref:putative phosphothreonine lyase domain-containing protein n=1 Tax=Nitrosomonas sp. JL21 TaxID=153949 RepID=UPI00136F8F29|nr:putative phosphothreonine lyase domain-containg protein [Nitrosomonas sp. JL21]MXS77402.1 DUF1917 domain-containing protein [Nitrosomonas sp. JL21]
MRRNQLITAIIAEMDRIWGEDGFDGTHDDYQWLQQNYGISEENDVLWQLILEYDANELSDEDLEDQELMGFLEDKKAVRQFLECHLKSYRNAFTISPKRKCLVDETSQDSALQYPRPSLVTDEDWIRAKRQTGTYPPRSERGGKWLIFVPIENLDGTWEKIRIATERGELGASSKVATAKPNKNAVTNNQKVICIYTYDWTDLEDVMKIRDQLRQLGITWKIPYKSDEDTNAGKYANRGSGKMSKYYE